MLQKGNSVAASTLRAFFKETGQPTEFESFLEEQLDEILKNFTFVLGQEMGSCTKGKFAEFAIWDTQILASPTSQ